MMKTYRFDPSKLKTQLMRVVRIYSLTFLGMGGLLLALNWGRETMNTVRWMLPLMFALFAYSGYSSYRQRKTLWDDFTLELHEDYFIQNQPKYPELRLNREDLTDLQEAKFGTLISSRQGRNILVISKELPEADYEELIATLRVWLLENREAAALLDDDDDDYYGEEAMELPEAEVDEDDADESRVEALTDDDEAGT